MQNMLITTFPREWDASKIISFLKRRGCEVTLRYFECPPTEDELIELLKGVDGVIAGSHPFTRRVLYSADKLKVISRTGAGFDTIDLKAATERGIIVTTTPEANSESVHFVHRRLRLMVADFAMGLLLSLARQIPQGDRDVRAGVFSPRMGVEVYGKTLGIIGLGRIDKRLAKRGRGFDMTILAYDTYQDTAFAAQQCITYLPLDELLARSDFVSIHLPLTPETSGLIGERKLRLMKPTAYLINTARGVIVDEASLIKALREGWIAGAGLDVFASEPPFHSPLLSMEKVILSPHAASFTKEAWARMAKEAAENVVKVFAMLTDDFVLRFEGKQPSSVVNSSAAREKG